MISQFSWISWISKQSFHQLSIFHAQWADLWLEYAYGHVVELIYKLTPWDHESDKSRQEQIYALLTNKPGSNKEQQDFGKT